MNNTLSIKNLEELIYIREVKASFDKENKELRDRLQVITERISKLQKDLTKLSEEKARVKESRGVC